MSFTDIIYTVDQGVATITLNRPQAMNTMSPNMMAEWIQALELSRDDPQVKVVVVTGSGRHFCGGGDVRGSARLAAQAGPGEPAPAPARSTAMAVPRAVAALDKPYIAAVNGGAAGGGMDLASVADIRIASEQAKFRMAYVGIGMIPTVGGCYFLPRIVGVARALDLIWTGRVMDAPEALRIGYVSQVVPHDQLMPATYELARRLAQGPSLAINTAKRLIYQCLELDLEAALKAHEEAMPRIQATEDSLEGRRAYIEKREPRFMGR